ncbi:nucleotidyltransferase family protein [Parafrankia elaeagni]|uniref:nucleotidyltransferase family protein n=1 Tax=Parafrankia elaeagni TaxID=222534 RepID=UPI0003694571|nr:NTP transferase domain-containing protein [Parafrankia elaeagni]
MTGHLPGVAGSGPPRPGPGAGPRSGPRTGARVVAAVLAAGSGSRMGTPKAELRIGGARLVDRAVEAARDAGCARIIAVVRAGTAVPGAECVVNPAPERGLRSSLALALELAAATDPHPPPFDAIALLLVDMPGVSGDAIRAVAAAWRPGRIAIGRYGDRRGHPIVMASDQWHAAIALASPDEGARRFLDAHTDLVDAVPVRGDPADLDTPDDLARWTSV